MKVIKVRQSLSLENGRSLKCTGHIMQIFGTNQTKLILPPNQPYVCFVMKHYHLAKDSKFGSKNKKPIKCSILAFGSFDFTPISKEKEEYPI